MLNNYKIPWLGLLAIAFGIFLLTIAIPFGVSTPSNVEILVLSPKFWPTIISWILIILGSLIVIQSYFAFKLQTETVGERQSEGGASDIASGKKASAAPWLRLLGMVGLMAVLVYATPVLGMVWTAMICSVLFALIVRTPEPVTSVIVAILLPLILYAFFNHVAGVAVPQGEFLRLP